MSRMQKKYLFLIILWVIGAFAVVYFWVFPKSATGETKERKPEKIVLSVLAGQSTSDGGIEDMITRAVAKAYTGVELEWECVDWGEDFAAKLCARFAAGNVPDIIIGKAQDAVVYSENGYLAPVRDSYQDLLEEEALKAVTVDGVLYGVPYNVCYQGVLYNKKLFEQYGLKIPETYSQLKEVVRILEENDITPFASHFLEDWSVGNMTMQFFMNELFIRNENWGDDFRSGSVSFRDNEAVKQCLMNNREIMEHSWEDVLDIDQYESDRRFFAGEAAMYLTGSWSMQMAELYNGDMEIGIFPFPNEDGDARLIRETNLTFMLGAGSAHKELASGVIRSIMENKELTEDILSYTRTCSTRKAKDTGYQMPLQADVEAYGAAGRVIDVNLGNTQLVWTFQSELAKEERAYLMNEKGLNEVLEFADERRTESKGNPAAD